jgi:hypothetical protein
MQYFRRTHFLNKPPNIDLSRKVHYEANYLAQQVLKLVVHHQEKPTAYNPIRFTITNLLMVLLNLNLQTSVQKIFFFIFYD